MKHFVNNRSLFNEYPEGVSEIIFGAGCFWGVERVFWELDGVWVTYASYSGGRRPNPSYEQVCTGVTGHAETVNVIYDSKKITTEELLKVFWEAHDPTQGYRQGNDIGTQYRSAIYADDAAQLAIVRDSAVAYGKALKAEGNSEITTEIRLAPPFYYAEDYHQQYLHKVPNGYCGLKGTGVACMID